MDYEYEVISRSLCPETGWTLVRLLHQDPSTQPFWRRAWWAWRSRQYGGFGYALTTLWREWWASPLPPLEIDAFYSSDGGYIAPVGSSLADMLEQHGICPHLYPPGDACTIGFSEREQKWYGWGHDSPLGFAVGDRIATSGHICSQSGWTDDYLSEHPERDHRLPVGFVAETLDDAKLMAIAFADAVG